jgi:ribosomal protein S6--L-glutamate ligase
VPKGQKLAPKVTKIAKLQAPLNIVILSCGPHLYSTRRLVEAGRKLGHKVRVLNTLQCELVMHGEGPSILYRGKLLKRPDVVLPRIGASITQYGLAVVNQFDMMDVPVVNNSVPIARARDKLRALQLLARFELDIPRTLITRRAEDLEKSIALLGGYPVILKVLQGTQGVGVMIALFVFGGRLSPSPLACGQPPATAPLPPTSLRLRGREASWPLRSVMRLRRSWGSDVRFRDHPR